MGITDFIETLRSQRLLLLTDADQLLLRSETGKLNTGDINNYGELVAYIKAKKSDLLTYLRQSPMTASLRQMQPNVAAVYPLSPLQEGMLFHALYDPQSTDYTEQFSCTLTGPLDPASLRQAWLVVMAHHTILRTSFHAQNLSVPLQCVHRQVDLPFTYTDYTDLTAYEQQTRLTQWLDADYRSGFDLQCPPLMRVALFKLSTECYRLVWTMHHLIIDGWSVQIVLGELLQHYQRVAQGQLLTASPNEDRYETLINYLRAKPQSAANAFWKRYLGNVKTPTKLAGHTAADQADTTTPVASHALSVPQTERLVAFARTHQLTPNTLVQGSWALLLAAHTGQQAVTFGVTVAGRPSDLDDVERKVGLFINTLPLTTRLRSAQSVLDWLGDVQQGQTEAREFQHTSLTAIQDGLGLREGLFDTILVVENYPFDSALDSNGLFAVTDASLREQTNYPLTVVVELTDVLTVGFHYKAAAFTAAQIAELGQQFEQVLVQLIDNPATQPVAQLAEALPEHYRDWLRTEASPTPTNEPIEGPRVAAQHATTAEEQTLLAIWQQLLPGRKISVDDNYFSVGGNSIGVIQMVSQARQKGLNLRVKDVFVYPTVRQLAQSLSATMGEQGVLSGVVPLLPGQQLFLEQGPFGSNQAMLVGIDKQVEVAQLTTAIRQLVARHDALRLRYDRTAAGWQQTYGSQPGQLLQIDLTHTDPEVVSATIAARCQFYQQSLSVAEGSMYRFVFFKTPADIAQNQLFLVIHQLAVDTHSWGILLNDLAGCLDAAMTGKTSQMPPKGHSYRQWGNALTAYAQSEAATSQLAYWQNAVADARPLPTDSNNAPGTLADTRTHTLTLDTYLTDRLLQRESATEQADVEDVLLTALWQTFSTWSGHKTLAISVEGHGREPINTDTDISQTTGCFTTHYPLRLDLASVPAAERVQHLHQHRRNVPDKGLGYGALRYLHPDTAIRTQLASCDGWNELIFRYVQPTGLSPQNSRWLSTDAELAATYTDPGQPCTSKFAVVASVGNGQLIVCFTYSARQYAEPTVVALATAFGQHLADLVGTSSATANVPVRAVSGAHLVPLQPLGSHSPVFIVPGGFGKADWYTDLAQAMGTTRPVYGIQTWGTQPGEQPHEQIEAIARQNLTWIRTQQPDGPLTLIGHSLGGRVAFEMARQEEAAGRAVGFVAVVDTTPAIPRLTRQEKAEAFIDRLALFASQNALPFPDGWQHTLTDQLPMTTVAETWAVLEATILDLFPGMLVHFEAFALELRMLLSNLNITYSPGGPIRCPVCLLKAADTDWTNQTPDLGWAALTTDLRILTIPGDHQTLMIGQQATEAGRVLTAQLAQAY